MKQARFPLDSVTLGKPNSCVIPAIQSPLQDSWRPLPAADLDLFQVGRRAVRQSESWPTNRLQPLRTQQAWTNCHCHPGDCPPHPLQPPLSRNIYYTSPRHRDPEKTQCESFPMPSPGLHLCSWSPEHPVPLTPTPSQAPGNAKQMRTQECPRARLAKLKDHFIIFSKSG